MKPFIKTTLLSTATAFLLVALTFIASTNASAQEAPKFTVKLKLNVHDGDYKNALITITKNGAPFKVIDPDGSTKNIDLDLNADYLITFSKMGYITKQVTYNTKVPDGRSNDPFSKFKCTVDIWPQPEDAIVKFSQPVGMIKYNVETGDFDYDKNYMSTALEMQKQAAEHPTPAPKPPPPPPPKVEPPPPPPPKPVEVSKPIPIEIKQPEVVHEPPPPPKKKEVPPPPPPKKVEKNSVEKVFQDDHKKTTLVIVTIDGVDVVYKKEEYTWGATYYYKNNVYITENTFRSETE